MNLFKNKHIEILLALVCVLLLLTAVLTFYNRKVMEESTLKRTQVEAAKLEFVYEANENIRHMDVGLRGYAVTHLRKWLYLSPSEILDDQENSYIRLDSILKSQGYNDVKGTEALLEFRAFFKYYFEYFVSMVSDLDRNDTLQFMKDFIVDKGELYGPAVRKAKRYIFDFEDSMDQQAKEAYSSAMSRISYLQIIMIILALPTIYLVIRKLNEDKRYQFALLEKLDLTQREYIFNPGESIGIKSIARVIDTSIANFKQAAHFLTQISSGTYDMDWEGMNVSNADLNTNTLSGKIISLQTDLKRIKQEDDRRNWTNNGLTEVSDKVRLKNTDLKELVEDVLFFIVKYVKASHGGVYLLEETENKYLNLTACYAFDRKKYLTRRIEIGEGLLGQVFLEKETQYVENIPKGYLFISSSMGSSEPKSLILVPLKFDDHPLGVLELASFQTLRDFEIIFIEKAVEILSGAVVKVSASIKTLALLNKTQEQAEQLRASQEIMRQQIEELTAMQESTKHLQG